MAQVYQLLRSGNLNFFVCLFVCLFIYLLTKTEKLLLMHFLKSELPLYLLLQMYLLYQISNKQLYSCILTLESDACANRMLKRPSFVKLIRQRLSSE